MFPEVDRILLTREQIGDRVAQMAQKLASDLQADLAADADAGAEDRVVLVPIMTGAMILTADLIRQMPIKLSLGLMAVSSYPGATIKSKEAHLASDLPENLEGKHVVVIDDILDSGRTLALVSRLVLARNPASLRIAILLDKQVERDEEVTVDYVGFEIPDEFVVGYGLDYDGYYRNHPDIVVLSKKALGIGE